MGRSRTTTWGEEPATELVAKVDLSAIQHGVEHAYKIYRVLHKEHTPLK